jgi:hypothetical protein
MREEVESTRKVDNDRLLEMSYQTGETRRSSVQIRPTPPTIFPILGKNLAYFEQAWRFNVRDKK